MKDIICPHCGTTFQVDESMYAALLQQVRSKEFNDELAAREKEIHEQFKLKEDSLRSKAEIPLQNQIHNKDIEIGDLTAKIKELEGKLSGFDANKKSELTGIIAAKDREISEIKSAKELEIARLQSANANKISEMSAAEALHISEIKAQKERELSELKAEKDRELIEVINEKNRKISDLQNQVANNEENTKRIILEEKNNTAEFIKGKELEIIRLEMEVKSSRMEAQNREAQLREQHKIQLDDKQAEIDRLKDFRLRQSTKMVGETLEQHCAMEFMEAQSNGMFRSASFGKDNLVVEGTKGDFIFRDYIGSGDEKEEYVSVMLEMKNEMDETASKHHNDDFLEKLDKDRRRKNCEYAVLVSMLEQDNEVYNRGIVDKSYLYPKMLVIRPQFFIPVLRLISEGAKSAFLQNQDLKRQLIEAQNTSRDFTKFEERIDKFRDDFTKNLAAARKKYDDATEGIDKAIEGLEKQIKLLRKIKEDFAASESKLLKANEVMDEKLTIKKLTYGVPAVKKAIEEANS